MNRKEITKSLSKDLEEYLGVSDTRVYWAKEVTFDYATSHKTRVDYMKFVSLNNSTSGIEKGNFYCYEIKSSVEDFHNKNGHNFLGDYNYYVMPEEVFEEVKTEIPFYVGVLVPANSFYKTLKSVKNARRKDRTHSVGEMLLMMFRSANRDRINKNKE